MDMSRDQLLQYEFEAQFSDNADALTSVHPVSPLSSDHIDLLSSQGEERASASAITFKRENSGLDWKDLPEMNFARLGIASAVHQNKLYVFGGLYKRKKTNSVERFDPETNSWVSLPPMNKERSLASCAVVGDEIFVIGGDNQKGLSRNGEVFDIRTEKWTAMPAMSIARDKHASIGVGQKVYVFGGSNSEGATEAYDTVTKEWTILSPMKVERYSFATIEANGKIYAIGGKKNFPRGLNKVESQYHRYYETFEEYNIERDEWIISEAKMSNRRCGCSAVAIGGLIHVIGGVDHEGIVMPIESFDFAKQKWSPSFIGPPKGEYKQTLAMMMTENDLVYIGHDSQVKRTFMKYSLPKIPFKNLTIPSINESTNINPNEKIPGFLSTDTNTKRQKRKYVRRSINIPRKKRCSRTATEKEMVSTGDSATEKRKKNIRSKTEKASIRDSKTEKKKKNIRRSATEKKKKKKKERSTFAFKNARVAKKFKAGIFFGRVVACKRTSQRKYWTVLYDDGDFEDLEREDLKKAIKFFSEEEKRRVQIGKESTTKQKETSDQNQQSQGSTLDISELKSLREIMDAKKEEISRKEKDEFGEEQNGALQSRIERLEQIEHVKEMEKDMFGSVQSGEYQARVDNLKSLLGVPN